MVTGFRSHSNYSLIFAVVKFLLILSAEGYFRRIDGIKFTSSLFCSLINSGLVLALDCHCRESHASFRTTQLRVSLNGRIIHDKRVHFFFIVIVSKRKKKIRLKNLFVLSSLNKSSVFQKALLSVDARDRL